MTERDIVLFLGAGFSSDAGLPTMSAFGTASDFELKTLKDHHITNSSHRNRNAAPMLVEAGETFHLFQKFCKNSNTISDSDVENIETVFCIAETLKESGCTELNLENQCYNIDVLISHIQLWLWKIYQQCPVMNPENNRNKKVNEKTYDRFFPIIKKYCKRITVISTNYDLIYEFLSWKHDMHCFYPFNNDKNIKAIGAGHGSVKYICQNENEHPDTLLMCKLHGSVNYFQNVCKDETDDLFVACDLGNEKPIGKSGVWKDRPALFAVDAIWNIRMKYGETFTPAIIPPTYAKLARKSWLVKIWNSTFNVLKSAKKIIFIGYSMPESDGFIKSLIHGAMASRNCTTLPEIYAIDPCEKVFKEYRRFFNEMFKSKEPEDFNCAVKGTLEKLFN